jgi:hypothetical protein
MVYRTPSGDDDELIGRLRARAENPTHSRASKASIAEAETQVGFPLPLLLRRIYLEVSSGGFGPGDGLIRVEAKNGHTLASLYEAMWTTEWPEKLLAIVDLGSEIYLCVDCLVPDGSIVAATDDGLWASELTLRSLFEAWLDGVDVYAELFEPVVERVGVNPFTKERTVLRSPGKPKGREWSREAGA